MSPAFIKILHLFLILVKSRSDTCDISEFKTTKCGINVDLILDKWYYYNIKILLKEEGCFMKTKLVPSIISVVLSLLTVGLFAAVTAGFMYPENLDVTIFRFHEYEAYVLCGLCYLYIFRHAVLNVKKESVKVGLSALCSLICTVQIYLLNNLWHYIEFNKFFDWVDPVRYSYFLVDDLRNMTMFMAIRYPLVFLLMFSACITVVISVPMFAPKLFDWLEAKKLILVEQYDSEENRTERKGDLSMEVVYTKNAPDAIGPYSQAIVTNGLVFTSGQIAINPENGLVEARTVTEQTEQVCENIKAVLEASGSSLEKVVKTVCFLKDMGDFAAFNEVYAKYFTGKPARSCVAVKELPKNVLVEIDTVAEI